MNDHPTIALVMISNFGRADGGRETWAYQFLPRLLARYPDLRLTLFGLRVDGEADSSGDLRDRLGDATNRVALHFFRARRNRIPNLLFMVRAMALYVRRGDGPAPAFTLCVGSVIEYLCAMASPRLRRSPGIVWLRSIFIDEKAARIPPRFRPLLRSIETAILRRADLLIANGDDTAAYYRARGLTVEVIKNAVELDKWRMLPPAFTSPIKVAYIGRLAPVKGFNEYLTLARAMQAPERAERFEFHLIGDGDSPQREQASRAMMDGAIVYHGGIENDRLPTMLGDIDVCVALGFVGASAAGAAGGAGVSNAVLEQMAAGRLLVAWDNVAYRQILDDDSAWFVAQGDASGLVTALEQIAANRDEAANRAEKAMTRARNYGFDDHLARFEAVTAKWNGNMIKMAERVYVQSS